jgi:CRP-like cAMP-binding protein
MFVELLETLFAGCDISELWDRSEGPRIETRAGQTLFDVHDPITEAFLIVEGRVILFSGEGSPRPLLRMAGPALCGDVELLLGAELHSHSARCLDRCRVAILSRADLDGLAASPTATAWYADIARRYHRTMATAIYEGLPIEVRLGRWLEDNFGETEFDLPADKEIARHLCVSPDRIGRARRAIERQGALVTEHGRTRIDPAHLEEPLASSLIHSIPHS